MCTYYIMSTGPSADSITVFLLCLYACTYNVHAFHSGTYIRINTYVRDMNGSPQKTSLESQERWPSKSDAQN